MRSSLPHGVAAIAAAFTFSLAGSASALQPLATFIEGARANHPEARVADATIRQREAEVDQARARLLPSFAARGALTHNQFEAVVSTPGGGQLVIVPKNQLDAFFQLDVPVVDLTQFARYDAQKIQAELAAASGSLTRRQLEERVVRGYYLLTAASALGRTTERNLEVAEKNRQVVKERVAAGVAPELDLERANANVERAKQDVADATLSRTLAARSLETLSRVTPEPASVFPEDDLREEAPLASWLASAKEVLPELRVAELEGRLADANRKTARYAYFPSLAAQAQERITNATGFANRSASYTLSATLSFRFDLGTLAQQDVAKAAAEVTQARAENTRRNAEDAIVDAWHRIQANIAKARAARAQVKAADSAARIAQDRYSIGASTQLDVTQAQRDAFTADVARIQADLDLTQARAILRIASGKSNPGERQP